MQLRSRPVFARSLSKSKQPTTLTRNAFGRVSLNLQSRCVADASAWRIQSRIFPGIREVYKRYLVQVFCNPLGKNSPQNSRKA
jgi:hypothetical protein